MKVLSAYHTSLAKGATGSCTTEITNKTKEVYVLWNTTNAVYSKVSSGYVGLPHKTTLYQEIATVTCTGMHGAVHKLPSKVIAEHLTVKI